MILRVFLSNALKNNSKMINYSLPTVNCVDDEFGLDEENDDNAVENHARDEPVDESLSSLQSDQSSDDENILNLTKSDFRGIRIADTINTRLKQSYFKVKINENIIYIYVHKQSACWMFSHDSSKLSNDRLSRVRQQTMNNS